MWIPRLPSPQSLQLWWRNHGVPLLVFALLSLALTWPALRFFTTALLAQGLDSYHNLWIMWHVREALLGNHSWFDMNLLYYPQGISLLLDGVGPLVGFFALPFWPLGREAAHNGAVLISFWLSGYGMYLLGRNLSMPIGISLFMGLLLQVSELHLASLLGHVEKTFLGLLPLLLLTARNTFTLQRSRWWALATAVVLLLLLLHSGWQFVIAALPLPIIWLARLLAAEPGARRQLVVRGALLAVAALAGTGWLLYQIIQVANAGEVPVDSLSQAAAHSPSLLEFVLPGRFSHLSAGWVWQVFTSLGINSTTETAVGLAWVGLLLCGLALLSRNRSAWRWVLFTFAYAALSLGPTLKLTQQDLLAVYELPLVMPFTLLTRLPGLDFMRTPGRFMQMGYVGFAAAAGYGLFWLTQRFPRRRRAIVLGAAVLLLLETWPRPWPSMELPPTLPFHQQMAQDAEVYGVLDLPLRERSGPSIMPVLFSRYYMVDQTVHGKGIAFGYISRAYSEHPFLPCLHEERRVLADIQINDRPVACGHALHLALARNNYRYVIWHKPARGLLDSTSGSTRDKESRELIRLVFGDQAPIYSDELSTVYKVQDIESLDSLAVHLQDNWYPRETQAQKSWRWAASPAELLITSPREQCVVLELDLFVMHTRPGAPRGAGTFEVAIDDSVVTTVDAYVGQPLRIPLSLDEGGQTVELALQAGNFDPETPKDDRLLSFSINDLNMKTAAHGVVPAMCGQ